MGKVLKWGVMGVMILLLSLLGLWKLSSSRHYQMFGQLVTRVETPHKQVALTFDDGPMPDYTEAMIQMLEQHQIKATFFVTGAESEQYPQAAQQLVKAGHELGNHSYSHRRMVFKSPRFVAQEIERTDAAIRAAGWQGPILFRPPYGKRLVVLPWYLAQHDRITALWDLEPDSDPQLSQSPEALAQHVIDRAQPGSVILLHVMYPSRETSRQAVPLIVEGLKAKGFRFVTLGEMLQGRE